MSGDPTATEQPDPTPEKSGLLLGTTRFPRAQDHGIFMNYPTKRNAGKAPATPSAAEPKK